MKRRTQQQEKYNFKNTKIKINNQHTNKKGEQRGGGEERVQRWPSG